ncbi:hypothetical protein Acor_78550 [Acrocarpospora corrugata]|uniref:Uncharacterized protein n=1 Tax=Acrocarpospora corrugata TaxID=35763 RepID=A0A5M3WAG3_9ACTN|nr:hypothetical protein [Acrocarpospora corrugata]GES05786.1 hypothetical protein Acor_78550 [Acrocarpospora corrugata]
MILLPLPKSLTAAFLVVAPTATRQDSPTAALSDLAIEEVTAADPRVMAVTELLCCADCSPGFGSLLSRLEGAPHLLVTCTSTPGWPLSHLWAGASAARALATTLGGVPIDADTARPLPASLLPATPPVTIHPELTPSPSVPSPPFDNFAVAPWLRVTSGFDSTGLQLATHGMTRLGLPELRVFGVPEPHVPRWTTTLHGLAHALLTRQFAGLATYPGRSSQVLPTELTLTANDISKAEGHKPSVRPKPSLVSEEPVGGEPSVDREGSRGVGTSGGRGGAGSARPVMDGGGAGDLEGSRGARPSGGPGGSRGAGSSMDGRGAGGPEGLRGARPVMDGRGAGGLEESGGWVRGGEWWREVGLRYEVLRGGAQFLNVWALDEVD